MKKLILLLLFIPLVSFGQENVKIEYFESKNPFLDNDKLLIIKFCEDYCVSHSRTIKETKSAEYYYAPRDIYQDKGLKLTITKTDISPLSFSFSHQGYYKGVYNRIALNFSKIEFIFDNDIKTKLVWDKLLFDDFNENIPVWNNEKDGIDIIKGYSGNEEKRHSGLQITTDGFPSIKDMNNVFLLKLQRHNSVYIKLTDNYDNVRYTEFKLKGITSALNKLKEYSPPTKKNMFDYKVVSGLANANPFDLETYIDKFILDAKENHNIDLSYVNKNDKRDRLIIFRQLEGLMIAAAYASDNDDQVYIKVDPENWQQASQAKRWYIIYHELGHDILNLDHGECGPMMNSVAKANYSWKELERDKNTMFEAYKKM